MFDLFSFTDDLKDLASALVQAQTRMGAAVKDSKNPHFRSSYASLTAVIHAVVPALNEQGIAVLQMPHTDEGVVQLTTTLLHTSGQMISSTVGTPMGKKQDAQAVGSAITYLRRYSLQSIMGLPVEDDDGNAASQRPVSHRAPNPQRTTPSVPAPKPVSAEDIEAYHRQLEGAGLDPKMVAAFMSDHGKPPASKANSEQLHNRLQWVRRHAATILQWAEQA